jgi:hypothetical protein
MTITEGDSLSKIKGFERSDPRRERAIWIRLYFYSILQRSDTPSEREIRLDLSHTIDRYGISNSMLGYGSIIETNNNYDEVTQRVIFSLRDPITPGKLIDWISNEPRQMQWFQAYAAEELSSFFGINVGSINASPDTDYFNSMNTSAYNHAIALLDLIPNNATSNPIAAPKPQTKTDFIQRLRENWHYFQESTRHISKFFENNTDEKIALIQDSKTLSSTLRMNNSFAEKHGIPFALDKMVMNGRDAEVKVFLDKARALYNKATYNERNKYAKQMNSILPIDLIEKLERTAASQGIKRNELVVRLLRKGLESKQ